MTLQITESEASLSTQTLNEVESRLGIQLPAMYRAFLLQHNGGRSKPRVFRFKNQSGAYSDSCIDWFLAVYDGEYDNFEKYYRTFKVNRVRLPVELVPISRTIQVAT